LECGDTGYRFYYPFTTAGGAEFYQELELAVAKRGGEYYRDWDEDHQFGFNQIRPGENVLEIGSNTGNFLKRVAEITDNVTGLDFNPSAIEKAAAKGIAVLNESIELHADRHKGEYDVVCAFQVFEHLSQIGPMLTAILKALKRGGKVVLSVPNNEPFFQRFSKYEPLNMPPHHAGLWNLAAFERLAEHFDMILAEHQYYGTRGLLPDVYLRSKLIADVRSLPMRHSVVDKIKMLALAPITLPLSSFDFLIRGIRNHAYISVIFHKTST